MIRVMWATLNRLSFRFDRLQWSMFPVKHWLANQGQWARLRILIVVAPAYCGLFD